MAHGETPFFGAQDSLEVAEKEEPLFVQFSTHCPDLEAAFKVYS